MFWIQVSLASLIIAALSELCLLLVDESDDDSMTVNTSVENDNIIK